MLHRLPARTREMQGTDSKSAWLALRHSARSQGLQQVTDFVIASNVDGLAQSAACDFGGQAAGAFDVG